MNFDKGRRMHGGQKSRKLTVMERRVKQLLSGAIIVGINDLCLGVLLPQFLQSKFQLSIVILGKCIVFLETPILIVACFVWTLE